MARGTRWTVGLLLAATLAPAAQAGVPAVQSHRGGPVLDGVPAFAEETLPAFRHAADELGTVLELDVKLTADRVPVVIHDDTLDRTTACEGLVAARTLTELAACPPDVLGSPGNGLATAPALEPVAIPTLSEVLAFARATGIGINLEIKNYPTDDDYDPTPAFAERVMDDVLASGIPARQVIIQSFLPTTLDTAQARMPDAELSLLALADTQDAALEYAASRGWDWVSPAWPVSPEYVDRAHARGLKVVPYTLNFPQDVAAAADAGVEAVITDDPAMALRTLDRTPPTVVVEPRRLGLAAVRRRGALAVRVSADERATVVLKLRVAGRRAGRSVVAFDAARTRRRAVRLNRGALGALARERRARIVLVARAADVAGNRSSRRSVVRLTRRATPPRGAANTRG